MAATFGIDLDTGALALGDVRLIPFQDQQTALAAIEPFSPFFAFGHGNRTSLDILFGGEPASLGLLFREGRLASADLSLPSGDPMGWPIGDAAKKLAEQVRDIFRRDHGVVWGELGARYPWGLIYSYAYTVLGAPALGPRHGILYGAGDFAETFRACP